MATLLAPAWACTSVPFCEQQPDKCVAGDEGESGGSDTSEDASSTEDTSGADSDGDSSGRYVATARSRAKKNATTPTRIDGDGLRQRLHLDTGGRHHPRRLPRLRVDRRRPSALLGTQRLRPARLRQHRQRRRRRATQRGR
ncbi:hypothetical protein [Pseudenhygromyxa sp. WMMC2535]|uniref:hypothetical protein n=1 Tax=Pseudenhygromyxa sp. WMMC2535 TaxID=2712867 RepID=UPI0020D18CF9|nr:hypothetical protein [Pseudenhygromyxa sp. WMMC2535]